MCFSLDVRPTHGLKRTMEVAQPLSFVTGLLPWWTTLANACTCTEGKIGRLDNVWSWSVLFFVFWTQYGIGRDQALWKCSGELSANAKNSEPKVVFLKFPCHKLDDNTSPWPGFAVRRTMCGTLTLTPTPGLKHTMAAALRHRSVLRLCSWWTPLAIAAGFGEERETPISSMMSGTLTWPATHGPRLMMGQARLLL